MVYFKQKKLTDVARPDLSEFYVKELLPYTHFYMALYYRFSDKSGQAFTRPVFLLK